MPAAAIELFDRPRLGESDPSKDRRVRRFLVDFEPDMALFDPTLPSYGSVYPGGNPNVPFPLILDSYTIAEVLQTPDHIRTIVECNYSNDRAGRLDPRPDRTRDTFSTWEFAPQETQVDFHTLLRYNLKVPGAAVLEAETPTLVPRIYKISETLTVIQHSVAIKTFTLQSLSAITAQNGRIHKMPNGQIWRFKAGQVVQTEKTTWEATYTWVRDTGTLKPDQYVGGGLGGSGTDYEPLYLVAPNRVLCSPTFGPDLWNNIDASVAQPGEFIRSPYHITTYVVHEEMYPIYYQHLPYKYDPLGWQVLPGFNP